MSYTSESNCMSYNLQFFSGNPFSIGGMKKLYWAIIYHNSTTTQLKSYVCNYCVQQIQGRTTANSSMWGLLICVSHQLLGKPGLLEVIFPFGLIVGKKKSLAGFQSDFVAQMISALLIQIKHTLHPEFCKSACTY